MKEQIKKKEIHHADHIFYRTLQGFAVATVLLLFLLISRLTFLSLPIFEKMGSTFLWSSDWDPVQQIYGVKAFAFGTVFSSLLALILAVPVSVGTALFLTEMAPKWLGKFLGFLVEMLAAIPSVVYGLWGIFVLAPWLQNIVQPMLAERFGFLPFFEGAPYGVGMMAGSIVLAIMITPTMAALSREVFRSIPSTQREAALGLGATRWEMIRLAVLKSSTSGLIGAMILSFGRALGETMAVTMVIGNRPQISWSLFAPAQTMASVIANEYAESVHELHLSALVAVGLSLLGVSLFVNMAARIWISYVEARLRGSR